MSEAIPPEQGAILVLIACADRDEALRIGTALVTEHLAACVHLRPHEAIYCWQGKIEHHAEYAVLAKTMTARYTALEQRVTALHSYAVPGIVAVKVDFALPQFAAWIGASVAVNAA